MRLVVEGGLASLYGVVWVMCMCGIGVMASLCVPSLAGVSTKSLPSIHV